MNKVSDFIKKERVFSIMQYFEALKFRPKEQFRVYEIMYVRAGTKIRKGKKEPTLELAFKRLTEEEIDFLKLNLNKFKMRINNKDGRIYEFMNL